MEKIPIDFVKKLMNEIGERYWFKFEAIGMEEDHMHVVVGAAPRYSPSRIMQILKSISAKEIFKNFEDIKEILWGGEFWSDGGHIDTVSDHGGLEKIKKYVEEQGRNKAQLRLAAFT